LLEETCSNDKSTYTILGAVIFATPEHLRTLFISSFPVDTTWSTVASCLSTGRLNGSGSGLT